MRHLLISLTLLCATWALAQPSEPTTEPTEPTAETGAAVSAEVAKPAGSSPTSFALVPKVGGVFPQVLNRLGTSFVVGLEADYLLPVLERQLGLALEGSYSQPLHRRTVEDPRVPDGSVTYQVQEQVFGVYLGPKYFFFPLDSTVLPFASAGVRAQFLASQAQGSGGGNPFGRQKETGTHFAFALQGGAGFLLGPGHLVAELQFLSSPIDHLVTGDVNIGDLGLRAGYLLRF